MALPERQKRKRRIAADEAHAWARNLRLKNPYAKLVLATLTLYVNGEGACFVSISQLAEDTEFAPETVRRRLLWLESIGAVVRMPQWLDENGRRNSDGRGKRTTDEIRLMVDADPEIIEAAASGRTEPVEENSTSEASQISHSPRRVTNLASENEPTPPLTPPLALQQQSKSGGGLISEPEPEPEPEVSPQPPSGGPLPEDEFCRFQKVWDEPMTRPSLARQVWGVLTPEERDLACLAATGYFLWRKAQAKPPHATAAQTFLREPQSWLKFAELAKKKTAVEGTWIVENSDGDRALRFALRWVRAVVPMIRKHPADGTQGYPWRAPIGRDLLAMLPFEGQSELRWPAVEIGTAECAAWRQRVWLWTNAELNPQPGERIIRVPCQWPPSKEGILYEDAIAEAGIDEESIDQPIGDSGDSPS